MIFLNNIIDFTIDLLHKNFSNYNPILLNFTSKDYRELIYKQSISKFLFMQYLFARKFYLLKKMGKSFEATNQLFYFLREINSILEENRIIINVDINDEEFILFKHIYIFQIINGFIEIFTPRDNEIGNNQKIESLKLNISILRDLSTFHLKKIGFMLFPLNSNIYEVKLKS